MVEGRLGKIAKELALLEQPFIKDTTKTVGEHIKEAVAAIGENIQARPQPSRQPSCVFVAMRGGKE